MVKRYRNHVAWLRAINIDRPGDPIKILTRISNILLGEAGRILEETRKAVHRLNFENFFRFDCSDGFVSVAVSKLRLLTHKVLGASVWRLFTRTIAVWLP